MYTMHHRLAGTVYLCSRLADGLPGYRLILADVYTVHAYFDCINYVWIVHVDSVQFVRELLAGQHFNIVERIL